MIIVSFLSLTLVLFRIVVRGPWLVLATGSVILLVFGSSTGFTFLQLPLPLDASLAPLLMLLLLPPPLPSALLSGIIGSVTCAGPTFRLLLVVVLLGRFSVTPPCPVWDVSLASSYSFRILLARLCLFD